MVRNPQFSRFILASGVTNLADGIAVVVWAWVATMLTRDPFLVALMPVALRLPWFLFALPAGIVTDRVNRKTLILTMDILRAAAFGVAAILVYVSLPFDPPTDEGTAMPGLFAALMTCALVVGTAEVFRDNAAQTVLPALVPHTDLEKANGRLWSVELVGNTLLGPAAGAFLIAALVWLPFATNTAAFAIAALLIVGLKGQFSAAAPKIRNWRAELGEGLAYLRDAPLLRLLAVVTGLWNLFDQMVVIALVLYVQEVLGLGAQAYGLMLSAAAFGGIAGGFCADAIVRKLGPGRAAQYAQFASALTFAAIPFAPNAVTLAVILATFEFVGLTWNTVSVSYRQRTIPNALLGRVNSVYRLLAWGMMPIGLLLSGALVSASESIVTRETALTIPFIVAAIGVIALSALTWKPLGEGFRDRASTK
ncbi:MFS transporter [Marivita hallyeonensis]|uniref:Transmembrane secretion effector n=1 Tax=Marivita hallyeonensis TaxID=996342 RepID=A0A1M5WHJ8_9RHOB|nr:MFS transporter [Marivita hallyeonensis]SHH86976.1 Transmembrane secretion effector [Marivita hallyeonensis]